MTSTDAIHSREEQARREVGMTAISRRAAIAFVLMFLATAAVVPLIDQTHGASTAWRRFAVRGDLRQSLHDTEHALEDQSAFARHIRPLAQTVLTKALAASNETVYLGRDGWLFYAPDVRHLTMGGFLEHAPDDPESRRRRQQPHDRSHDPITAITDFKSQLAARGIRLVIVPTPVKPMVQPQKLWRAAPSPLANASFERFKAEMESAGVLVFDPTADLAAAARNGTPQFLATDTHWRPEAMDRTSTRLANFVNKRIELPQTLGVEYSLREQTIRHHGDLAALLGLLPPPSPEQVAIEQVIAPDGRPWSPDEKSEVLWLGDSFSNIYSAGAMGWGASAGFAEQFSRHLGRPLDALRRNDDGAFATRQLLADEFARGNDRLAGKKLVIWQFAARELTFGDWKRIELKLGEKPARQFIVPPPGESWMARGTVASHGVAPRPGNVAYRDHLLAVHLTGVTVEGRPEAGEGVVYLRSMNDGVLTDAAALQIGQHVRLKLRDWSDVARQYEFTRRSELPEAELRSQPPCWGELLR